MRLITARTVSRFAEQHPESRQAFADWCAVVAASQWQNADAIKRTLGTAARPIGHHRCIFEILRNDFRIVAEVRYADPAHGLHGLVRVHFVGTHAEYDKIDAESVTLPPRSTR